MRRGLHAKGWLSGIFSTRSRQASRRQEPSRTFEGLEPRHLLDCGTFTISGSLSVDEGNPTSTGAATFTISLSPGCTSTTTATVTVETEGGTAVANTDFASFSQTLSFTSGDTSKTVNISILHDTLDELDETFKVKLSNPTNATLGASQNATVTIIDNDGISPANGFQLSGFLARDDESTDGGGCPVCSETSTKYSWSDAYTGYAVTDLNRLINSRTESTSTYSSSTSNTSTNLSSFVLPVYNTAFSSYFTVQAITTLPSDAPVADTYSVQYSFHSTHTSTTVMSDAVYYSNQTLSSGAISSGSTVVFASLFDARDIYPSVPGLQSLVTGHYDYQVHVTAHYSSGYATYTSPSGEMVVVNGAPYPGWDRSWAMSEMDRIYFETYDSTGQRVVLVRGDGTTAWFERPDSNSSFVNQAPGSASTLSIDGSGNYVVTTKYGTAYVFYGPGATNPGYLKDYVDSYGNVTLYAYTSGRLSSITDPYGRVLLYQDNTGADSRIDKIVDFASREIGVDNTTSGGLAGITLPDPDGPSGVSPLTIGLDYYPSDQGNKSGLLRKVSYSAALELGGTPVLHKLEIFYDHAAKVSKMESTDDAGWTLQSVQSKGVEYAANSQGTQQNPAVQLYATLLLASINPNINRALSALATREADRFGNMTESKDTSGNITSYTRSPTTSVLAEMTIDDPDGEGPLGDLTTTYTYDSKFNATKIQHPQNPNGTRDEVNIAYDATYALPTKITDELGRITKFTVQSGSITSIIQVVGKDDATASPPESNDVTVATLTYTTGTNGIPKGLLATSTDRYGVVTKYDYYTSSDGTAKRGRLKSVTYDYGGAAQYDEEFDYDQDGNLSAITDGKQNTTRLFYDRLGRLTRAVEAYPDAAIYVDRDNSDATGLFDKTETWSTVSGGFGTNYLVHDDTAGSASAVWTFGNLIPGKSYEVFATWVQAGTNSATAPYTIDYGGTQDPQVTGNQQNSPGTDHPFASGTWKSLGKYSVVGNVLTVTLSHTASGDIVADGMRLVEAAPETTLVYNELADLLKSIDPVGAATLFEYDAASRLVSLIEADPAGGSNNPTTVFGYDSRGNLDRITDALGRITDYWYDDLGRLAKEYLPYPDTNTAHWPAIDDEGTGYAQPSGNWSEHTAGGQGGDQQRSTDAGAAATWTFNTTTTGERIVPGKRYEAVASWYVAGAGPDTNNANIVVFSSYDGTTSGTLGSQERPSQQYPPVGHPLFGASWQTVGSLTATGDTITVKLTRETGNSGYLLADSVRLIEARPLTEFSYDTIGNLTADTDPNGRVTQYTYDNRLRLTQIVEPTVTGGSPTTRLRYDAASQLIAAIDPLNRVVRYEYDDFGRLKTVRMPHPGGTTGATTIDNGATGGWTSASQTGTWNGSYIHFTQTGSPSSTSWSTGTLSNNKEYEILATWYADASNGAKEAPFVVDPSWADPTTVKVDQSLAPLDGDVFADSSTKTWQSLGHFKTPASGTNSITVTLNSVVGKKVIADAIRIVEAAPKTSYAYTDATTNTATVTDALGNATVSEYDKFYRLKKVMLPDPEENASSADQPIWQYVYDNAHNLTQVIDPFNKATVYAYDGLNRLLTMTLPDADGASAKYEYQSVHALAYNALGQVVRYTDPKDRVTSYRYDVLQRLTKATKPPLAGSDPTVEYFYDDAGQLEEVTERIDNTRYRTTAYVYDGLGRVIESTLPDKGDGTATGEVYGASYDSLGNVLEAFDARGNATRYEYDALYRLAKKVLPDPDGAGTQLSPFADYSYDLASQNTSVNSALTATTSATTDQRTNYLYDRMGRRTEVHLPSPTGNGEPANPPDKHVYTYDAVGNVIAHTNVLGRVTDYEYDRLYRLKKRTDPDPDHYALDPGGTGNGARSRPETEYTYDLVGKVKTLTDPMNNVTSFFYDALYRLDREEITLASAARARTYVYDKTNNLIEKTDRNGRVTTYDYDALDRMVEEKWYADATKNPLLQTFSYGYDFVGAFTNAYEKDSVGSSWDSKYDYTRNYLGQVGTEDYAYKSIAVSLDRTFDADGRVLTLDAEIGATPRHDFKNTYEYDAIGRMTKIKQEDQDTETNYNRVAEKLVELNYRADGRFDTITRYSALAGGMSNDVLKSTFSYDERGRLTGLLHEELVGTTSTVADYDFVYNKANLLESKTEAFLGASAATTTFGYNRVDELISVDYPTGSDFSDETVVWDENGNRLNAPWTTGAYNRATHDGLFTYTYGNTQLGEWEGNVTNIEDTSSPGLNQIKTKLEWDHRNRLTKVVIESWNGSAYVHARTITYEYDAFDRRIEKYRLNDTQQTPSLDNVSYYVYDGQDIVLRFDRDNKLRDRYLHGPAVDQILAEEKYTSAQDPANVTGTTHWAATDHLGSVRQLVDNNGAQTRYVDYSAWGAADITGGSVVSIYGWTGREYDPETGYNYHRARYYNTTLRKWLSEDPIGFAAGDENLYRYVGNSPTNTTDPSGLYEAGSFEQEVADTLKELDPDLAEWWTRPGREGGVLTGGMKGGTWFWEDDLVPADDEAYWWHDGWFNHPSIRMGGDQDAIDAALFIIAQAHADGGAFAKEFKEWLLRNGRLEEWNKRVRDQVFAKLAEAGAAAEAAIFIFVSTLPGGGFAITLNTGLTKGFGAALVEFLTDHAVGAAFRVGAKFVKITTKCGKNFRIHKRLFDRLQLVLDDPAAKARLVAQLDKATDELQIIKTLLRETRAAEKAAAKAARFRRVPANLGERLVLNQAQAGAGQLIMRNLNDPRFKGMEKWQHVHVNPDGTKVVVHYVRDPSTGKLMDFKFKD